MSRVKAGNPVLECRWSHLLEDYVTAIVWLPDIAGAKNRLVASSAAGEVWLYPDKDPSQRICLQASYGQSVDCLAVSCDGQFLAASGQSGLVRIWNVQPEIPELIATLEHAPVWIDRMAWSPTQNQLAFSVGKSVQVWDAAIGKIVASLPFENSSVLDLTWHPDGDRLTVSGYQGVKIWNRQDWQEAPYFLEIPSASLAIAWSPDGQYIAAANLDLTLTVLEWDNPHPWVMRGFSGKARQLIWSPSQASRRSPLLVCSSLGAIVFWEKHPDVAIGWEGRVLEGHLEAIQAMQFQPGGALLASAATDGQICLWQKSKLAQVLQGAPQGFSSLVWHPQGALLAAGGQNGELLVWTKAARGEGFGRL
jgi:WD40 repeat protein